jgi:hypothetical protein
MSLYVALLPSGCTNGFVASASGVVEKVTDHVFRLHEKHYAIATVSVLEILRRLVV